MNHSGFNGFALNTAALGAGATRPWITGSGETVCAVVGTLETSLVQYGRTQQACTANATIRVLRSVPIPIWGTAKVVPTVPGSILLWTPVQVRGSAEVVGAVRGRINRFTRISLECRVDSLATPQVIHYEYGSGYQVCGINSATSGVTFSGLPTSERRVFVPHAARVMHISAANSAAGV